MNICAICAYCKSKLNFVFDEAGARQAHAGDFLMCIGCGEINRFDDEVKLRRITPEEERTYVAVLPDAVLFTQLITKADYLRRKAQFN